MKLRTMRVEKTDQVATGAEARKARIKAGKSLTLISQKLGFSPAYLSDLELGRRHWTAELLKRFERAL